MRKSPEGTSPVATKHSAVADTLRTEVLSGVWQVGDRIPSEQDIATRFGIAYMTARQAVSTLVSEGILERWGRKGTFVARMTPAAHPVTEHSFVLLIENGKTSMDPYYFPPIMEAFQNELRAHGYELEIYDYSMAILDGRLDKDAPVCCVLINEPETLYANLLKERGNTVFAVNRCNGGGAVPFATPDNIGGAQQAVQHLIDLGHRRIGFVRGIPGNIDAADRNRGYMQAMLSNGLEPGPVEGSHFVEASGYESAKRMLANPEPPTAIFCASDLSAIGAMKAVAEAGMSVPDDISVVGFGDFSMAMFLHPGLTTVRLPLPELGRTAAQAMLRMAKGDNVESTVLSCDLVVRETTTSPCAVAC